MALSTCSWVACMAGGNGAHRLIFWWQSRHAKWAVKPFRDFCNLLMPPPPKQHSQANPASYAGYSSVAPGTLNNCQESLLTGWQNYYSFERNPMRFWVISDTNFFYEKEMPRILVTSKCLGNLCTITFALPRNFEFHPSFNSLRKLYKWK